MESFGEYLRKERESRSVSLEEIAESTRIRKVFLEAIESDDTDNLPADVFVKGFLRAYSNYIGLNVTEVIVHYQNFLERQKGPEQVIDEPSKKGNFSLRVSSVLVATLLIFCVVFIFYVKQENKEGAEAPETVAFQQTSETIDEEEVSDEEAVSSEEIDEAPTITDEPDEESTPEPALVDKEIPINTAEDIGSQTEIQIEEEKILQVEAFEMTWLRVRVDDNPPFEVTLKSGENATWKALNTFDLRIGNAAGINVYYNGENIGLLGDKGKVISLTLPKGE